MKKEISTLIFVVILGSISAGLLVGINLYTKPLIEKNKAHRLKQAILDTLEISSDQQSIEEVFAQNIETIQKDNLNFYKTRQREIAFAFSGSGLWGPIQGIVALKQDLETIKGIKIIHQEETPGLGGRITEVEFLSQFKHKKVLPKILVDGITGATMTSRALEDLLNNQIKKYISLIK